MQKHNSIIVKESKISIVQENKSSKAQMQNRLCKSTRMQKHKSKIVQESKISTVQENKSPKAQRQNRLCNSTRAQLWKSAKCALVDWRMQEEEFASSELRESLCEAGRGATYVAHR